MPRDVSHFYDSLSFFPSINWQHFNSYLCFRIFPYLCSCNVFVSKLFAALRAFNEIWKAFFEEVISELWLSFFIHSTFSHLHVCRPRIFRWMKTLRCVQRGLLVLSNFSHLPWQETPPRFNRFPNQSRVGFSDCSSAFETLSRHCFLAVLEWFVGERRLLGLQFSTSKGSWSDRRCHSTSFIQCNAA